MGVSLETIKSSSFNEGLEYAINYLERLESGAVCSQALFLVPVYDLIFWGVGIMRVDLLDMYNIHDRYDGIVDCLSDGFGTISISKEYGIPVLLNKVASGHFVTMTIVNDEVVATATGFVEQKLIHAGVEKYKAKNTGSRVMHIEDCATRTNKRGNGYGTAAIKALHRIAEEENCYKIILDTSIGNYENFYSKLGYSKSELCLRKNIK